MNSDVILNKIQTIERCLNRIKAVYDMNPSNLNDFTKQDSIILNIQRACEASIDIAMHIVSMKKLGIPQTSRDSFVLLEKNHLITHSTSKSMKAMVGFRNIAIHDYQELNLEIVKAIIERHLEDFENFAKEIMLYTSK